MDVRSLRIIVTYLSDIIPHTNAQKHRYDLRTNEVFLVDFELQLYKGKKTIPTPPYGRELLGLLWHSIAIGWVSCRGIGDDFLPLSFFHFDNSIECTGTKLSQLNYEDDIPDLFRTRGCYNFGKNVLLKRQGLHIQNVPISKLPVKRSGLTLSGYKNRYMSLKVDDIHDATLSYVEDPKRINVFRTELSLRCGECEVQLSRLAGTGNSDVHVINKRFRSEEERLNWKSFSFKYRGSSAVPIAIALRTACCQPPITFPFGRMSAFSLSDTYYLEKHFSTESQQIVLYYGTHESGFDHFLVIRIEHFHVFYVSSGKTIRVTYDPRKETIPDETREADEELQHRLNDKFKALSRYERIIFTYDNGFARQHFTHYRNVNVADV